MGYFLSMKKIMFFIIPLVFILGCIQSSNDEIKNEKYQGIINENTNFTMFVSNQQRNIDPVDLSIFIDGKLIVSDEYYIGNMHNWIRYDINQTIGKHTIIVTSISGNYAINSTFEIKDKLWLVIDFWTENEYHSPITISQNDHEPMFM